MAYKLTKKKKLFAEAVVSGKSGAQAAKLAGYGTSPASHAAIGSQLLRKDREGRYTDTSLDKYFSELRGETGLVKSSGEIAKRPPTAQVVPGEVLTIEQIMGVLSDIARDDTVTTSTRVDAMKTLLKQYNEDRNREEWVDRDPEELRVYTQTLLGIKVEVGA